MTVPCVYEPRTYRDLRNTERFAAFRVEVETSDLYVKALSPLEQETERLIRESRAQVEWAIAARRSFLTSLVPIEEDPADSPLVLKMVRAGKKTGTGPMASVAGAVADYVGRGLLPLSPELIIENGGDIFLKIAEPVVVGLFAGNSPFNRRIGIRIPATPIPVGVCTSSATVGPSLSLGNADAATIVARDVIFADAMATALGNRIRIPSDLKSAVEWAVTVPGVDGALGVLGDKIAVCGEIDLVPLAEGSIEG
ncbi:MAG TPA: UPF0280 family protein [Desulfomonilaceae bacterium]|nr:UPF0280 family protein [Desulfomonilaceae bacterium]